VYGNERCEWYTWAPRLSGNNKETGEPYMQAEWVPTWGPRRWMIPVGFIVSRPHVLCLYRASPSPPSGSRML